ncbi:hypothetical protein D3C78_1114210 [compost metagenome]
MLDELLHRLEQFGRGVHLQLVEQGADWSNSPRIGINPPADLHQFVLDTVIQLGHRREHSPDVLHRRSRKGLLDGFSVPKLQADREQNIPFQFSRGTTQGPAEGLDDIG